MQKKPFVFLFKGMTLMRVAGLVAIATLALAACAPAATSTPTATTAATAAATATVAATAAATATGAATTPTAAGTMATTGTPAATTAAATPAATSSTPQATMAGTQPAASVALTVKNDAKLGNYLADANGMTLYQYAKDTAGKSTCEAACAQNWPPLLVAQGGKATITGGDQTLVGTITRSDGTTQVSYRNLPLYYFINDKAAGDTNGQGVGSVWAVVKP